MKLNYIFLSTFFLSIFLGATTSLAASDEQKTIGSLDAPVLIEAFSDFQCPFCADWHKNTYSQIEKNYITEGNVRVVIRHFPISALHEGALPSARAVECSAEQGKLKEFIDTVYNNQKALSTKNLESYADKLGLNVEKFNTCVVSPRIEAIINADLADGEARGVMGTPAFFVNGEIIEGAQSYDVFKEVIDRSLGVKSAKKLPKKTTGYDQMTEPVRGNGKAPVLITGYMGYNDPYSKQAWQTLDQLSDIYGENIGFEFRHYPLEFQDPLYFLALAGECTLSVGGIDAFFKFSDILMTNESTRQTAEDAIATAQGLGLEISDCVANELLLPEVINDMDDGTAFGVSGTPSFSVNGELVVGAVPLESFREVIDRYLPGIKTEPVKIGYCGDGLCGYDEMCTEDCGEAYVYTEPYMDPYYDVEPTSYYGFQNPFWLLLLWFF